VSQFVDECQLHVKAGDGGAGSVSFRREAHVPRGGPDGGDGGDGGDVWLVADRGAASLLAFRDHPFRRAGDGTHGHGRKRHGRSGADVEVAVPEGTVVKSRDGAVVADLLQAGDRWQAARGGRGGRGNARFLSNARRAPSFAEQGEVGEEHWYQLELKLFADVALVGYPNAGKSTLISVMSAARPKVADYPFTTLEPHLGVVRMDDGVEYVVADIPGLIEGAAGGKGLGHRFLRHVERARVLLLLLDLSPLATDPPEAQLRVLLSELEAYRPELLDRPRLVYGTKADLLGDTAAGGWDGPAISAVTGDGVRPLMGRLAQLVTEAREAQPKSEQYAVYRPEPTGIEVVRHDDGSFEVLGRSALRAVSLNDLTNADAMAYVQHRLHRLGVDSALARAGATDGDLVVIGPFSFEYQDEA
jgi:GTP-binding protein